MLTVNSPATQNPPIANFTMSAQGISANAPNTLNLVTPSSGGITVTLQSTSSQGSAPITSSYWTSSGSPICAQSTTTCSWPLTNGAHNLSVTLNVTDSNNRTVSITGQVVVTVQQAAKPTITGYSWNPAAPTAGQFFSGTVTGNGIRHRWHAGLLLPLRYPNLLPATGSGSNGDRFGQSFDLECKSRHTRSLGLLCDNLGWPVFAFSQLCCCLSRTHDQHD